jgi:DNA polymerase-3 subunit alpha
MTNIKDSLVKKITLTLPLHELSDKLIAELSFLIKNNQGGCSLYFKIEDMEKHLTVSLFTENQKFTVNKEIVRFLEDNEMKFKIN